MSIELIIPGIPVSWRSHAGFGRRSFNPRFKEKECYEWNIKQQYKRGIISDPVSIICTYKMPIPKSVSKRQRENMKEGLIYHSKRPDIDNLNKFLCDCLKTIVFYDDSQIHTIHANKIYSETPETIVRIDLNI